jgi:heterodisulfide reductase subunit B
MPARNLGLAEATGLSEMVIPCSACYSRTLVAQTQMMNNAELRADINEELSAKVQGTIKVSSILEALLTTVESGELKEKMSQKLEGLKPVCYYGCILTRFPIDVPVPDSVENPQGMEKILKVLGAEAIDWNYKTDCCGASAAVNDSETSNNLMARIMKDAVARGANCFVVTCPMCQLNMDAFQDQFCEEHGIQERLPVYFLTELIGLAMGMDVEELQIDRHFVESTMLLEGVGSV